MENNKIEYTLKLDKPLIILLWVFAVGIILNALPSGSIIPEAVAELDRNPTITLVLRERGGVDLDD